MTVSIGFVGAGNIAQTHLDNLEDREDASVDAVCDVDSETAASAAERMGATAFSEVETMFGEFDLDAAFVCIPPFAHGEAERTAAEHGVHLFVEKPLAIETATARDILATIEAAGIMAAVGHNWRYSGGVERAASLFEDATIGYLDGHWWGGVPGGMDHWWRHVDRSGGQPIEQAVHIFDTVRHLGGDIETVYAAGGNRLVDMVDFPDVSSATMRHENEVVSHVSSSCATDDGGNGVDIIADRGTVTVTQRRISGTVDGDPIDETFDIDPYARELDAFIEAVETGSADGLRSTYDDAIRSLAVTEAVMRSMESGEVVEVDDLL